MSIWWLRVPYIEFQENGVTQNTWDKYFKTLRIISMDRFNLTMDTGLIFFTLPKEDLQQAQQVLDYLNASKRLDISFTLYENRAVLYNVTNSQMSITSLIEIVRRIEQMCDKLPKALAVSDAQKFYLYFNSAIVNDSTIPTLSYVWAGALENYSISADIQSSPRKISVSMRFFTVRLSEA